MLEAFFCNASAYLMNLIGCARTHMNDRRTGYSLIPPSDSACNPAQHWKSESSKATPGCMYESAGNVTIS
jgi:hypothetical protein